MICPCCRVMTNPVEEQGIMAAKCPRCGGIWISKIALGRLTQRVAGDTVGEAGAGEAPLQELAAQVTKSNSTGELECPYCQKAMVKERFHPMIPVEMDRCETCDYVWLDAGEQELLLVLYRQLMSKMTRPWRINGINWRGWMPCGRK